jgi:HK97 family phage major capsid protein
MTPRYVPTQQDRRAAQRAKDAERDRVAAEKVDRADEAAVVDARSAELNRKAARVIAAAERARRDPTSGEAWAAIGVAPNDREAQEYVLEHDQVYGRQSPHSWFCDLMRDHLARHTVLTSDGHAVSRGDVLPFDERSGSLKDARARLATVETRDVTSSDPGVAAFLPSDAPSFIASHFANAARAAAVLASAMRVEPLPRKGSDVSIPKFSVGAAAGIQATEGSAATEEEAVDSEDVNVPKRTISGQVVQSLQAFVFGGAAWDAALASELGRAVGASLDAQIISGSGTSGQLLGLASASGIIAISHATAGSAADDISKIWSAYSSLATAPTGFGAPDTSAYLTILHPRRLAKFYANGGGPAEALATPPLLPGTVVPCGGVRTNLGAGKNEDEIFVLVRDETPLYLSPVRIVAIEDDAVSGNLQVRVRAHQFAALASARQVKAIARVSGAALVPPSL